MAYAKRGRKPKGIKKELTVQWIVVGKKMIKFIEESDKTYKLADNVIEYLDEIKSNVPVNVTIVGDSVIFIQKREGAVTEEAEVEKEVVESSETQSDNQTYTVKAISKTRDYYLFDECGEKEWFTVASNVKNFLKDVKKGDILEVKVEVSNDGKRDTRTITYAKIKATKEVEPKQETKNETTSTKKKSSYRDEGETTKRTALMTAKDIVCAYINSKAELVNGEAKVSGLLKRLTKTCYEIIESI